MNSTKSLTGHSLGAAGVHEAIYSILQMQGGFIAESANIEELDPEIADAPIVTSRIVSLRIRPINSSSQSNATKISEPVAAFCAIGNPEAFFKTLRDDDHQVCQTFVFRDHHKYTQADINRIVEQSQARGAKALLTTAKDEVKLRSLRFDLPGYVVDVGIEIVQQAKVLELIEAAISKKKQGVPR